MATALECLAQLRRTTNIGSRKLYQGINPLLLELHSLHFGFRSKWWGTFHQWSNWGCTVKKRPEDVEPGHWGCNIVLWKPFTKVVAKDGQEEQHEFFMMRYFTVFCADQVEGESPRSFRFSMSRLPPCCPTTLLPKN